MVARDHTMLASSVIELILDSVMMMMMLLMMMQKGLNFGTVFNVCIISASDGKVQYTVLWLPERYSQLLLYVILLAGTVIGVILLVSSLILQPLCRKICFFVCPFCDAYSPISHACLVIFGHRLKTWYYVNLCPFLMRVCAVAFKHRKSSFKSASAMV